MASQASRRCAVADEPSAGLFGLFVAVSVALPWLLPTHAQPWTNFYADALMGAVLLPVAYRTLWVARRERWPADPLVLLFMGAAAVPLVQAAAGMYVFPFEAPLVAAQLSAFALLLVVARQAQRQLAGGLIEPVLAGLALAALLSTGMVLYQWAGLDAAGVLVMPLGPSGRPAANVGQPNLLATLQVWGLVALWWAYAHQRVGGRVAALGAAFLLLGVAITQSRTGWLAVGVLLLAAVLARKTLRTAGQIPAVIALFGWFVMVVLAWGPLNHWLLNEPALKLSDQVIAGKRPAIWALAVEAIAQRPWTGYGWNQGSLAHVALAPDMPALHVVVQYAHNLALDLLLWNGLPLGLLMIGALAWWLLDRIRRAASAAEMLLLLALGVFLLHAMLELPHANATFLLTAAVLLGCLTALSPARHGLSLRTSWIVAWIGVHTALLGVMWVEYTRIEADLIARRMQAAHIIGSAHEPLPAIRVLSMLPQALEILNTVPQRRMSPEQLERFRAVVSRYPSNTGLFRYARAAALNGHPNDAAWALLVLCKLHPESVCQPALQAWHTLAAQDEPELTHVPLPISDAPSAVPAR